MYRIRGKQIVAVQQTLPKEALRESFPAVAGNEHAAGVGGGDMSYVIDEEQGYAVLDESAFLGWDYSGSSDSGRISEITKWSVH